MSKITLETAFQIVDELGLDDFTGFAIMTDPGIMPKFRRDCAMNEQTTNIAREQQLAATMIWRALFNSRAFNQHSPAATVISNEPPLMYWQPMTLWREV